MNAFEGYFSRNPRQQLSLRLFRKLAYVFHNPIRYIKIAIAPYLTAFVIVERYRFTFINQRCLRDVFRGH